MKKTPEPSWSTTQRWKNDFFYICIKVLFDIFPFVSRRSLQRFGRLIGAVAYVALPRARRIAEANLALAFPELSSKERAALCRRNYATLGHFLGDGLAIASGRQPLIFPFEAGSEAILRAAIDEGRGVVLVSAHLGPWESVAASLVAQGVPLVTLVRAPYDPRLAFVFDRVRQRAGVRAIDRTAPGAATRIVRVLRGSKSARASEGGGVLGAPMDLAARVPSVVVPFLGQPASTPIGPARLAIRSRAAIVVVTAARGDASERDGAVEKLILRSERVVYGSHDDPREVTAHINDVLSARVRAYPSGWVWMHERFAAARTPHRLATGAQHDAHPARHNSDGRPSPHGGGDE